jgi:hypothetical protein
MPLGVRNVAKGAKRPRTVGHDFRHFHGSFGRSVIAVLPPLVWIRRVAPNATGAVIWVSAIVVIARVVFAARLVVAVVCVRRLHIPRLTRASAHSLRLASAIILLLFAFHRFVASGGVVHRRDVLAVERREIDSRTVVRVTRVRSVPSD